MWYTTADARRDAEKQAANQRDDRQSPNCSSFCARGEPCSITEDGKCDAACDSAMPANVELSGPTAALSPEGPVEGTVRRLYAKW